MFKKLHPKKLNFNLGLTVVNRSKRFVLPIPNWGNRGEALIFPQESRRAGQIMKRGTGKEADFGVVFYNGIDLAWQAVRSHGKEAIVLNDISHTQAKEIMSKYTQLHLDKITLQGVKELLQYAKEEIGIIDFYNTSLKSVQRNTEIISTEIPHFRQVNKTDQHKALYIQEAFVFDGPVEQVYPNGAIILNNGKHTWGIGAEVFQRNFKLLTSNGERELKSLKEEFQQRSKNV